MPDMLVAIARSDAFRHQKVKAMKLLKHDLPTLGKPALEPTRRQLLKALGVGAAAAPLLPRWTPGPRRRPASACCCCSPRRASCPRQWYPTGTETAWTFPAGGITRAADQAQGRT